MVSEEQLRKEIEENTAMQAYFKNFDPGSVQHFINSYARNKSYWLNYGKKELINKENHDIQWVNRATKHLGMILQKKLFDAQCLWRAEQLEIPGIDICFDFEIWEKNILNCPFIEPVTNSDIELYAQYLLSSNAADISHKYESLQDYEEIIAAYNNNSDEIDFPEWYDFYNGRRGTGVLMTLPNIRGEKEKFYLELPSKLAGNKAEESPYIPPKHIDYYDDEQRDWFIQTFENKEVQSYYHAYEWSNRNDGLKEDLEYYIDVLCDADEPVAMEPDLDWSEAIIKTANRYTNKKIAEALPEAWEQYMINIQMNIAFPVDEEYVRSWDFIKTAYAERILEGRKLNGEPEDFNF